MTLNLLVVVCGFLIGFFVISTGGGGATLYLGVFHFVPWGFNGAVRIKCRPRG